MTKDERAVVAVNASFYEAFCRRDLERMEELWATDHDVTVIHPGWPRLHGREDVMESWRRIMQSPSSPDIACTAVHPHVFGEIAVVVCTEKLFTGDLIATNIFVREGNAWKMIHHHAGPTQSDETSETIH